MEATASSGVYQWEVRRRTRLAEELERTRREIAARRVRIPAAPDLARRRFGELPAACRLVVPWMRVSAQRVSHRSRWAWA